MKIHLLTLALCSAAFLSAAPQWADKAYPQRMEISLNAGMTPGKTPIAAVKLPHAAPGGVKLVDSKGKVIDVAVKQDQAGDWFAAWKPAGLKMLEKRSYQLYFGGKTPNKALAGFPENFPGMNIVPNGNLAKIKEGVPEGWFMSSKGYGLQDKWNENNKKLVKLVKMKGANALEIRGVMAIHVKLTPGRQYELSYDGWFEKGRFGVTLWFRGKTIHEYLVKELNVGNYKMQTYVPRPNEVMKVVCSTFGYMDRKTKKSAQGKKLLPFTRMGFIQINVPKGSFGRIANLKLEDITDRGSIKIKCGKVESLKK